MLALLRSLFVNMITIRDIDKNRRIWDFLNSAPRFRFIVIRDDSFDEDIPHVNVGHLISCYLKEHQMSKESINGAKDFLLNQIVENTQTEQEYGKYICLTNVGILFEKNLDFVPTEFLANISKNTTLLLHWPGEIVLQKLFFLEEGSKFFIDLKNINYITI